MRHCVGDLGNEGLGLDSVHRPDGVGDDLDALLEVAGLDVEQVQRRDVGLDLVDRVSEAIALSHEIDKILDVVLRAAIAAPWGRLGT